MEVTRWFCRLSLYVPGAMILPWVLRQAQVSGTLPAGSGVLWTILLLYHAVALVLFILAYRGDRQNEEYEQTDTVPDYPVPVEEEPVRGAHPNDVPLFPGGEAEVLRVRPRKRPQKSG